MERRRSSTGENPHFGRARRLRARCEATNSLSIDSSGFIGRPIGERGSRRSVECRRHGFAETWTSAALQEDAVAPRPCTSAPCACREKRHFMSLVESIAPRHADGLAVVAKSLSHQRRWYTPR